MKMDRFVNNLRVLWHADSTIADIRLRHLLARSGLNAVAGLIAVFGLLMFELAAYLMLLQIWNEIASALVLGSLNFILAGILFLIAARKKPGGRELELANEIHKSAVEALQADARLVQQEWALVGRTLRNPLEGVLPLIVPLATIVINMLKKPKAEPK